MIEHRKETRAHIQLMVHISGRDARCEPFARTVKASNLSRSGALLSDVTIELKGGDVLTLAYEGREANFRIVWALHSGGDAGTEVAIQKVEGQLCPWEEVLVVMPRDGSCPLLETSGDCLQRDLKQSWGIDFARTSLPMWIFDQATLAFLAVNNAAVEAYGYSEKEFLSMTILDIRPQDDIGMVLKATLYPNELTGDIRHWRHTKKDGSVFIVELSGRALVFERRRAQLVSVHKMVRAASR